MLLAGILSENFWTIVGSVFAGVSVAATLFIWRQQLTRDRRSPSRQDVFIIESLISKILLNAQLINSIPMEDRNDATTQHPVDVINSTVLEIREKLNTLVNRECKNKKIVNVANNFYSSLLISINQKTINSDDIQEKLADLRMAVR